MKIYVIATIKSKPEFQSDIEAVLKNMVSETRKEKACLQYDLHQSLEDKSQFVFYEIWENRQGLEQHNEQPYIKAFGELTAEKLQEIPIIYLTTKL